MNNFHINDLLKNLFQVPHYHHRKKQKNPWDLVDGKTVIDDKEKNNQKMTAERKGKCPHVILGKTKCTVSKLLHFFKVNLLIKLQSSKIKTLITWNPQT